MAANQCGELYRSHSGSDDLDVQRVSILKGWSTYGMYIGNPANDDLKMWAECIT